MRSQSPCILLTGFNTNYIIVYLMPSRADDSFLQYPFKNLGFMRFPEPIFAGICQNILIKPYFLACLQFEHIFNVPSVFSIQS